MTTRLRAVLVLVATAAALSLSASAQQPPQAPAARGYYLVQLQGPVLEEWKAALTTAGAEILEYVPDFAFKVRVNPGQASQLARLPFVSAVTRVERPGKFGPRFAPNAAGVYIARIERGAPASEVEEAIRGAGAQVLRRTERLVVLRATAAELDAVADLDDVAAIENVELRRKHNEYGGGVIMRANLANAGGFDGSTQTIAIADTGLGNGTAASAHADLPASRIAAMFNWPGAESLCFDTIVNDGAADVDTGHGTHVATAALGDGALDGSARGTAPASRLVFQAIENWAAPSFLCSLLYGLDEGYYLVGLPEDIGEVFQQAYDSGARVHSNSWGSESSSAYTNDSVNADAFVWAHRDLTITLSAGNSGRDANNNSVIDAETINAPGTAKNVITVGASENDRQSHWECDTTLTTTDCAAQGGQNVLFTYGAGFPDRFTTLPWRDDASAGNDQQLAAFSSRGPAVDLRIKPDVVAPGTWMLSGYADRYQQGYDPSPNPQNGLFQYDGWGFPHSQAYKYMGGTSMAAPLVAGAAAVVRDYYEKTRAHQASAALVKATLINSAVDLLDENNDGVNDNAFPIPNNHEGWGRVDVLRATSPREFDDETTPLATGASRTLRYAVDTGGSPLKVTLVWTDYPSTTSAARNLVNDLDLTLTAPDGTLYRGNWFAGGWALTGGSADRVNNVENVFVNAAAAGEWIVRVTAYNVPMGPQHFALVVDGALPGSGASLPIVSLTTTDATATEAGLTTGSFTVSRSGETTSALTVAYAIGGSASAGADYVALPVNVTIPEGASTATLLVEPLDDTTVEASEIVSVSLMSGSGYDIGAPTSGAVTITSDDLPPDLTMTALTVPTTGAAGSPIAVNDTTRNQGTAPAEASQTGFFLSTNTTLDAADVQLGYRTVSALAAATNEAATTTLTIPATISGGTYYVIAKADWAGAIIETQENNNVRASGQMKVGPDLTINALTAPAAAAAGGSIAVNDTTRNQGGAPAPESTTSFYLSLNTALDGGDPFLGMRDVPALAPGATHTLVTTVTLPAGTVAGSYYVIAKADGPDAVGETNETNNLRTSSIVRVGPDLTVSAVTVPATAAAGDTINVADTMRNLGAQASEATTAAFYLSVNPTLEPTDLLLGTRVVAAIAAGATATASTPVVLPADTVTGSYYVFAHVDPNNTVAEAQETNNVLRSAAIRLGPDLTVSAFSGPTNTVAGATITVSDTTRNSGGGVAASSSTSFYLSLNVTFDASDTLLASRTVSALNAGASETGTTSLTLPAGLAPATYYLFAVADAPGAIAETTETNNSRVYGIRINP